MTRWFCVVLSAALTSTIACGASKTPTAPSASTTATQTRIIGLGGNLDFGNIQIGTSFSATMNIRNSGNSVLTITGITGSGGITTVTKANWTSGTIPAGASQDVSFTFSPPAPQTYSGTITVNGDQTAGTNTIAMTGNGSLNGVPVFTKTGTGDNVFDLPTYITRVHITATTANSCQNFVVKVAGRLLVNVILGTCSVADSRSYDGTLTIAGGGTVETQLSTGVNWTVSEVR